jgi:serine/threonine protein kinase
VQGIDYIYEKQRGRGYIVMERVYGQSLLHYIHQSRKGPLNDDGLARHIMRAVFSGLEHMHDLGVVHRDMNPTNVFVHHQEGSLPVVKILDFNVSKLMLSGFPGRPANQVTDAFDENSLDKIMQGMQI